MRKTTVYLPDEMKAALEALSSETGRSEADLIRDAVGALTAGKQAIAPRFPLFDSGDPISERVDELLHAGFGLD